MTDPFGNPLSGDRDRVLTALKGDVNGDLVVNISTGQKPNTPESG